MCPQRSDKHLDCYPYSRPHNRLRLHHSIVSNPLGRHRPSQRIHRCPSRYIRDSSSVEVPNVVGQLSALHHWHCHRSHHHLGRTTDLAHSGMHLHLELRSTLHHHRNTHLHRYQRSRIGPDRMFRGCVAGITFCSGRGLSPYPSPSWSDHCVASPRKASAPSVTVHIEPLIPVGSGRLHHLRPRLDIHFGRCSSML